MEPKKGYKQTEVGVIPEDWEVMRMKDCCTKITDGTHYTPKPVEMGIPFLTAIHVKENSIDFRGCYYLPKDVHDEIFRRCNPERNDVLMVNIGAGVATTALVNVDYEFSLKNVALLKPSKKVLIGSFLNYYQEFVKNRITTSISTGGAQPFLSLNQIGNLQISIPNTTEQTAIATALSDTDALISRLETLIDKKRAIKQGAMQQLLKPKEGWVVKKLGEVLRVRHGKSQKDVIAEDGDFPILASGGVIGRAHTFLYDKPSVLIGRKGTIDVPQYMNTPFWSVDTLFYTEIFEKYDAKFIFYVFNLIDWYSFNEASGVPSLNAKTIEGIEKYFPKTKSEQSRIAQILSDMNAEITVLEQKLAKYKRLKQGMMQELLTGKTRLI